MQDFLFLLWFDNSLYFLELNIFIRFNDSWDVAMDLTITVTFFRNMTTLFILFQPVDRKNHLKINSARFIEIQEILKEFSEILP